MLRESSAPEVGSNVLTSLPRVRSSIVGREGELHELLGLVGSPECSSVVTIVGSGGIGKTRLVVELVYRLADEGVRVGFVELADVALACDVLDAIADQLSIEVVPGASVFDGLVSWLGVAPTVLFVDNFEHVLDAARDIGGLVDRCPELRLVVTSRRPLALLGECTFALPPLPAEAPDDLGRAPGVRLFVERASLRRPKQNELDAARRIVAAVGGLPLAIELAAYRARTLGVSAVLELLAANLMLDGLEGSIDGPQRHRSLRECLEWSYRDLDEQEQSVFRTVGAFDGTFDVESLRAVVGMESRVTAALAMLADHHLVFADDTAEGAARFAMSPPIREYARELLRADPDHTRIRLAHADYYASIASELRESFDKTGAEAVIAAFLREAPNINRAVGTRFLGADYTAAAAISCDVAKIVTEIGREARLKNWFRDLVLAAGAATVELPREARIWGAYAELAAGGPASAAVPLQALEQEIAEARAAGDNAALITGCDRMTAGFVVHGDVARSGAAAGEGADIAGRLGLRRRRAQFLIWHGMLLHVLGDTERAYALGREGLRIARELGDRRLLVRAGLLYAPMRVAGTAPDDGESFPSLEACLETAQACGSPLDELYVTMQLAIRAGFNANADACALARRGFDLADRTRHHAAELVHVLALAGAAFNAEDDAIAIRFHASVRGEWSAISTMFPPSALEHYAEIVEARRALDPERFDRMMEDAAATPWPDVLLLARRYAETHAPEPAAIRLTKREVDVLREMVTGATNKQIAQSLEMRPKTVMHHCAAIYRKLGVTSRGQATAEATRRGLLQRT